MHFLDITMKRKEYGDISFGCYALLTIFFLNASTAMTTNELDADLKLDLVADKVKEKGKWLTKYGSKGN